MTDSRKNAEAVIERIEKLRQALAQPEQEKYAIEVVAMHEDGTYITKRTPMPKPKREWVGLTDEEINLIYAQPQTHAGQYAKAIEAKLKEKNT